MHYVIWESQVGRVGDLKKYLTFGEEGGASPEIWEYEVLAFF